MSAAPFAGGGKITAPGILSRKSLLLAGSPEARKITCLTAYDYATARLVDEAGSGLGISEIGADVSRFCTGLVRKLGRDPLADL